MEEGRQGRAGNSHIAGCSNLDLEVVVDWEEVLQDTLDNCHTVDCNMQDLAAVVELLDWVAVDKAAEQPESERSQHSKLALE